MTNKKSKIKSLPPKILIQEKDNVTGSYPTNVRTASDNRSGVYRIGFDDSKTIIFNNRSTTSRAGALFFSMADLQSGEAFGINQYGPPIEDLSINSRFYNASSNLIAHYRFEPSRETQDFSGNGNDGEFVSSGSKNYSLVSDTPFPGSKQALSLGTEAFFRILNTGSFSFGDSINDSAFSVGSWIKMANVEKFAIFSKGEDSGSVEWAFGTDSDKKLFFTLYDKDTTVERTLKVNFTMERYKGLWTHVAATYDGRGGDGTTNDETTSGVRLYINGQRIEDTDTRINGSYIAMHNSSSRAHIGFRAVPLSFASGTIDEVFLFNKSLSFNEVRRIMGFRDGISMPTRLPWDSPFLNQELTTSIYIPGDVVKGISDNFAHFSPGQDLQPFIEDNLFEQNQTGTFYTTGSSPNETSLGFNSPLKSKSRITFKVDVAEPVALPETTASVYYFSTTKRKWERIRSDLTPDPMAEKGLFSAAIGGTLDSMLFNAYGIPMISGTSVVTTDISGVKMYGFTEENFTYTTSGSLGMSKALYPHSILYTDHQLSGTNSITNEYVIQTLDERFAATSSQIFEPDISYPFLVEKIVADIPFMAGPGWLNDKTVYEIGTSNIQSFGGPCVIFAVQRQDSENRREIIVSGTVIPTGDNFVGTKTTWGFEYSGSFWSGPRSGPFGFKVVGTPSYVVVPNKGATFTGSVKIETKSSLSNGGLGYGYRDAPNSWAFGKSFYGESPAFMVGINPFGRAMDGKSSGRSYFGKEYITPSRNITFISGSNDTTKSREVVFYHGFGNATSPYLLLPGDKIIFSIYKHRPVHDGSILGGYGFGTGSVTGSILTSSHDVQLNSGTMSITFYGSLIRNGVEFHDTLNQLLTSKAIHEDVHGPDIPVLDQYDVVHPLILSGSYIDDLVEGKILIPTIGTHNGITTTIANQNGRKLIGSARRLNTRLRATDFITDSTNVFFGYKQARIEDSDVSGSLARNVNFIDNKERFYDSLTPRVDSITKVNGGDILYHPSKKTAIVQIGFYPHGWGLSSSSTNNDDVWNRSFPFEPRYSNIDKTVQPFRETKATLIFSTNGLVLSASDKKSDSVSILEKRSNEETNATTEFGQINGVIMTNSQFSRKYFGIGDGVQNSPEFYSDVTLDQDSEGNGTLNNYPYIKQRGWKYGLISALPLYNKAIFRRDRYGQVRDMLEQRQDTKFLLEEKGKKSSVVSSPIRIQFTELDPEDTSSSNMSFEATSSQPFFDADRNDLGRNRGELPSNEAISDP